MSHYQHLSIKERESLLEMLTLEKKVSEIAKVLGRSKSTISREIKRNSKKGKYSPYDAQQAYKKRRRKCRQEKKLNKNKELSETVVRLLKENQWSPEEIAHRIEAERGKKEISYSTIYRALKCGILEPKDKRKKHKGRYPLEKNLRRKNRPNGGNVGRSRFSDAPSIHDRPEEDEKSLEIGYMEGDTVYCSAAKQYFLTFVDRKSKYLLTGCCSGASEEEMTAAIINVLGNLSSDKLRSITLDRGSEFQCYKKVSELLNVPIYFADPMSPWQRGLNENTNGLIRQYIPKRSLKVPFSELFLQSITLKLNLRPRKSLNWKTPFEVFFSVSLLLT